MCVWYPPHCSLSLAFIHVYTFVFLARSCCECLCPTFVAKSLAGWMAMEKQWRLSSGLFVVVGHYGKWSRSGSLKAYHCQLRGKMKDRYTAEAGRGGGWKRGPGDEGGRGGSNENPEVHSVSKRDDEEMRPKIRKSRGQWSGNLWSSVAKLSVIRSLCQKYFRWQFRDKNDDDGGFQNNKILFVLLSFPILFSSSFEQPSIS